METTIEKLPTRSRILDVSKKLFLRQGFGETGLNQIVAEANTVKASLYQHFKSKEELGKTVLLGYARENLNLLSGLMNRHPLPQDFVRAWLRILKRQAKGSELYGCPMANFRAQIAESSPEILNSIYQVTGETIQLIENYLRAGMETGKIDSSTDPKRLARFLFISYEGVLQMWRLSGELKVFDDLTDITERLFPGNVRN